MMLFRGEVGAEDWEESCDAYVFLRLRARKRFRVELEPGVVLELDGEEPHGGDETVDTGRGFLSFLRVRWEGYDEAAEKPDIDVGPETIW